MIKVGSVELREKEAMDGKAVSARNARKETE